MLGKLYICGTPIGNIKDITLRCLETLQNVDIIFAEDTRNTIKLLNHYNIKKNIQSYHQHNKDSKGLKIIELLKEGKNIALVSDAGMPAISDPGEDLVNLCYKNNLNVTVVPGATAFVSALVLSGFRTRSFCFEGFLPSNKKTKRDFLHSLKLEKRTIILYEAPHNLNKTLEDLYQILGDRKVSVVREITKKYEEVQTGNLSKVLRSFKENLPKGEIVIIIEGVSKKEFDLNTENTFDNLTIQEHFENYIDLGYNFKEAMKLVAKDRKIGKRNVYKSLKIK